MRYLLPILFLPTLAHAHAGPHLHPHGIDAMWLIPVAALALAGGYALARWRK
ncbi:hypothetical protein [Roseovarius sp. MBR-6]|jgi:hypothetical protein|uniref:hypothetical protein n=1 Tax=Roseovarius sp. MBR-6 TaxID=3156459 RepID=UPI003393CDFC